MSSTSVCQVPFWMLVIAAVRKTDKVLDLVEVTLWKRMGRWRQPRENQHMFLVVVRDMKKHKAGYGIV